MEGRHATRLISSGYCHGILNQTLRSDSKVGSLVYYTIPYHTIPYHTIPYHTILYYTILYYTILYYTILYYTILYYTILYGHYIPLK